MRLDELSFIVRLEQRTTENSSSRRIIHLVPVFIFISNNQANIKCLPRLVQTDDAASSIKTANDSFLFLFLFFFCSTKTRDVPQRRVELQILDSIRSFPAPSPVIPALSTVEPRNKCDRWEANNYTPVFSDGIANED